MSFNLGRLLVALLQSISNRFMLLHPSYPSQLLPSDLLPNSLAYSCILFYFFLH